MNDWIRVVTLLPTCYVNLYRFLCLSVPFLCLNSFLIKWGSKIPAEKRIKAKKGAERQERGLSLCQVWGIRSVLRTHKTTSATDSPQCAQKRDAVCFQ